MLAKNSAVNSEAIIEKSHYICHTGALLGACRWWSGRALNSAQRVNKLKFSAVMATT